MNAFFRHKTAFLIALSLVVFSQCKNAFTPANWSIDVLAPIAIGNVNFSDLVVSDYLTSDSNDLIHLTYSDTIIRLGLDTLVGIPDTTIEEEFVIPIGGISFPPGTPFYVDTLRTKYKLNDIRLTYAEVRESLFTVELENRIDAPLLVRYTILSATKDGKEFVIEERLAAKTDFDDQFNLDGYSLDLRGIDQNTYNVLNSVVEVMIDPNETQSHTFSAGDRFAIKNTFEKIIPEYAVGFFGSNSTDYSDKTEIDAFNLLPVKAIDFSDFDVSLAIDNGIGADLELTIERLSAVNAHNSTEAELQHDIIGKKQQFGRALNLFDDQNPVKHTQKNYSFTQQNSNLDALIELLPSTIEYEIGIKTNPLGDISLGNDFIYYGHDLALMLDLDVPLSLGVEGLQLIDTFDLEFKRSDVAQLEQLESGYLNIYVDNGYPFETSIQLYMHNSDSTILDSIWTENTLVKSAIANGHGDVLESVESLIQVPLTQELIDRLDEATLVSFKGTVNTFDKQIIHVRSTQNLAFKIIVDVTGSVQ